MSKELGVDSLDENPFSFKKFIKSNVARGELESVSGGERSQIAPDPIDFRIQNVHATLGESCENPFSYKNFLQSCEESKDQITGIGVTCGTLSNYLLDFDQGYCVNDQKLSDSDLDIFNPPVNTACTVKDEHLGFDDALIAFKNRPLLFIQQLQEENRELRQQLLKTRAVACRESARAKQLLKDTDSAHKYEMDETAALEKMIQQVEGNLQATLQRAINAENSVMKLKQEIKTLKSFSSSLVVENEMLKSENCNSLKEKSTFAAEQITAAITNAEQLLKQLLNGIDNLKMVAKVLSSVDQIKDIPLDEVTDQ